MRFVYMSIIMMMLCGYAMGYEVSPRISDREIVERLTRLEEGQRALNKRIDSLEVSLNRRIDDVNRRIDDVNKRIDSLEVSLNKRIDDLRDEMVSRFRVIEWMLAIFISIFIVILGFILRMIWQIHKRQVKLEVEVKKQGEEISFIRSVIERLIPKGGVL